MKPVQDQQENVDSLAGLRLQIGEPVRVEVKVPRRRYTAKLLGYAEHAGVIISAPVNASAKAALVTEGNIVTVRLISGNRICSFQSKVLKANDQPFGHWVLEYPREIELNRIRQHTRVPVRLMVSVDDYDEMGERHDLPCSALCVDISLDGLRLQLPRVLGEVGSKFYLTTRVNVAGIAHVLLAPVEMRNTHNSGEDIGLMYNQGMKFLDLDEDTRLIIAAFVYQQFLVETGNLDRTGQEL